MELLSLAKKAEKFAFDNSPLILTMVGAAGVVTTGILATKAGYRAHEILINEDADRVNEARRLDKPEPEVLTRQEIIQLTWKLYIPATLNGLVTVTAIVAANQIGTRRAAAMAAAYTVSERAFSEYREKVYEKFGETKERQVRDEVAQDRIDKKPADASVIILSGGTQLCFDAWSGRYFMSDMETLKKAQNDLNYRIIRDNYASLTDFYNLIGLDSTAESDDIGWNVDKEFEIEFSTCLAHDGRPAISIDFRAVPIRNYFRLH